MSASAVEVFRAGPAPSADPPAARAVGLAGLVVIGAAAGAALAVGFTEREHPRRDAPSEARALHAAAALLGLAVLVDSAIEHYRANFENPGMLTPLAASSAVVARGVAGAAAPPAAPTASGTLAYGAAVVAGAAGTGFHLFNLARRPGGFGWLNLFYAAPLGAPAALSLAGLLGLAAERIGAREDTHPPRLLGRPAGRVLSALVSGGLAGTVGEAGLFHFRGAFQNPFMWLPVSLPPIAAALMGKAACEAEAPARRPLTRLWLGLTALLGIGGIGFHAFGVSRAMGGWRNWSQNLLDGPPLPAPPSFSALAIAGLAALSLRDREAAP